MSKQTIAIDLDDVLVNSSPEIIRYYNQTYGTAVTLADFYADDFSGAWQCPDRHTVSRRVNTYLDTPGYLELKPTIAAVEVLHKLKAVYNLVIVTGRPSFVEDITLQWLSKHLPDLFGDVVFSNFYGSDDVKRDKGEICTDLGASILIDDHLGHAKNAASHGVSVLLFGDFPWNRADELPENITRVANWRGVEQKLL